MRNPSIGVVSRLPRTTTEMPNGQLRFRSWPSASEGTCVWGRESRPRWSDVDDCGWAQWLLPPLMRVTSAPSPPVSPVSLAA